MFQPGKPQRNLVYAWEGEVDGLRAEIERLRGEIESWKALVQELESKLANRK